MSADHEFAARVFFVRLDGILAIKARIGAPKNLLHPRPQRGDRLLQVRLDLFAVRTVPIMQFPVEVLSCFRNERQDGLITQLAFVFRIVALARAHLFPVHRLHGRIGVNCRRLQMHVGSLPHPLPHDLLHL